MNREYAGFFDIGMVQRNEADAIIAHGTMCLIRRAALLDAGSWSSDTIVEDSDLGLALLARGWRAHYTKTRYGYGLLPTDFAAYKKQRHRWAYGGVQLIKKHWRAFLPGGSRLTPQQKGQFLFGWLTWLGAESLGVLIAILNLIWMPLVAFFAIAVPEAVLLMPVLATFAVTLLHFMVLYRTRVEAPIFASLGAALSAMALQFTVGRAVLDGVVRDELPFVRTAKGSTARWQNTFPALWEGVLGGLLRARRAHPPFDQREPGARGFDLQRRAVRAEPALPRGGRHGARRALGAEQLRHLAEACHAADLPAAPAARPRANRGPASGRRHGRSALALVPDFRPSISLTGVWLPALRPPTFVGEGSA